MIQENKFHSCVGTLINDNPYRYLAQHVMKRNSVKILNYVLDLNKHAQKMDHWLHLAPVEDAAVPNAEQETVDQEQLQPVAEGEGEGEGEGNDVPQDGDAVMIEQQQEETVEANADEQQQNDEQVQKSVDSEKAAETKEGPDFPGYQYLKN